MKQNKKFALKEARRIVLGGAADPDGGRKIKPYADRVRAGGAFAP